MSPDGKSWDCDGSLESMFALTARAWRSCEPPERVACAPRRPFDAGFFGWRERKEAAYLPRRLEAAVLRIWMSERPLLHSLLKVAARAGKSGQDALSDWSDPDVAEVARAIRAVCREEHLLKGFARFVEAEISVAPCGVEAEARGRCVPMRVFAAALEPDNDVIPALVPWFEARFGSKPFALADLRRGYSIVSDPSGQPRRRIGKGFAAPVGSDAGQDLWKRYFSATENRARNNPGLQRRLLPVRYRALMTEFSPDSPFRGNSGPGTGADLFGSPHVAR